MSQFGWANCPYPSRDQVATIRDGLLNVLGDNLIGIYLHGSLVLDCFNPERSDIDLLAVIEDGLALEAQRAVVQLMLAHSVPYEPPSLVRPVEISILRIDQLFPWQHPAPFDLHFSEHHRERLITQIADGSWQQWTSSNQRDADLAAHIWVTLKRGVCLYGAPINDVFPAVPEADFIAALHHDCTWTLDNMTVNPVYCVLSLCRAVAYLAERRLCSKDEGGAWALTWLPVEHRSMVAAALAIYRGDAPFAPFERGSLEAFAAFMRGQIVG